MFKKLLDYFKKEIRLTKEYYHPAQTRTERYPSIMQHKPIEVDGDMDKAAKIILRTGNASISMVERYTGWRYSKAARIMDSLESAGIVGPFIGSMPRKILISSEDYARCVVITSDISEATAQNIDFEQIIRDENEWRRQQRGLSPIEYELEQIDSMDGHSFERWCADLLEKNGFIDVKVIPGSGDQGVDILTVRDGIHYAIQCKCYSSDLGNTPVQEVYAGKEMYDCQVGVVMTNRYFTAGARQLAERTRVLLWDRDKLIEMLEQAR